MRTSTFLPLLVVTACNAFLPPTLPPFPPTYNMSMSTISMQVNSSGWSSPERGSQFGIISYDWSNAKEQWAASKPMDCEERLVTQANMTKSLNPQSNVFVYRNIVKALPWFSTVRAKLNDPAYSGWFLKFSSGGTPHVPACAAENASKCSVFYHDQEQTPEVPTAAAPHPDGSCTDNVCDCGVNPCGEYLFDHRNGSMLREWIVNEVIGGATGMGHTSIDGFFIDDFWCSDLLCSIPGTRGCPCGDPVQGPSEIDRNSQADMGLSDEDIRDITLAWNETMSAVQQKILDMNGYTWTLMLNQENANAYPVLLKEQSCSAMMKAACTESSEYQSNAVLFGLNVDGSNITQLEEDVAFFLLARGDYAWLGWGVWGMTWPFNPEPAHGELPPLPHGVPRPRELDLDYGTPLNKTCYETAHNVFERHYSHAVASLDCNSFVGSVMFT